MKVKNTSITALNPDTFRYILLYLSEATDKISFILTSKDFFSSYGSYYMLKLVIFAKYNVIANITKMFRNDSDTLSRLIFTRNQASDLSGRTFYNTSAFEYSLWSCDWRIWNLFKTLNIKAIALNQYNSFMYSNLRYSHAGTNSVEYSFSVKNSDYNNCISNDFARKYFDENTTTQNNTNKVISELSKSKTYTNRYIAAADSTVKYISCMPLLDNLITELSMVKIPSENEPDTYLRPQIIFTIVPCLQKLPLYMIEHLVIGNLHMGQMGFYIGAPERLMKVNDIIKKQERLPYNFFSDHYRALVHNDKNLYKKLKDKCNVELIELGRYLNKQ